MHSFWTLLRRPGARMPQVSDFALGSAPLPTGVDDGEVLIRNLYLSLDPYMRWRMNDAKSYAPPVGLGEVMVGATIGEVLESRHPGFAPGDHVVAPGGWQSHARLNGGRLRKIDAGELPLSVFLGALGSPGFTAWAGLRHIGKPAAGETLVVGAATGPVGAMVGQLAKAAGCRVVAICGGAEKTRLARETLGFDAAVDHRDPDLAARLADECPRGIDVYFENIGGKVLEAVRPLLNDFARIPVCGLVSQYNAAGDTVDLAPFMQDILVKRLTWRGFIVTDFQPDFPTFLSEVTPLVQAGNIRFIEDIREGLELAPQALIDVLQGDNRGKMVLSIG